MRRIPLFTLLLLVFLPSSWAREKVLSVDEVCAGAGLVVVGTLDKASGLAAKEMLYGCLPAEALTVHYRLWRCFVGHADKVGKECIWCLTRAEDGSWHADNTGSVIGVERRAEVEKAVQKRLEPDVQTLLEQKGFSGEGVGQRANPIYAVCKRLAEAGPAAVQPARRLMLHAEAIQRAWGCETAGWSGQKVLVPDLVALLPDRAEMTYVVG